MNPSVRPFLPENPINSKNPINPISFISPINSIHLVIPISSINPRRSINPVNPISSTNPINSIRLAFGLRVREEAYIFPVFLAFGQFLNLRRAITGPFGAQRGPTMSPRGPLDALWAHFGASGGAMLRTFGSPRGIYFLPWGHAGPSGQQALA